MNPKPKLKQKDLPAYREQLLKEQGGLCALCNQPIKEGDAALDHQHFGEGVVRAVLHKDCNILLGKIENYIYRQGKSMQVPGKLETFLHKAYSYIIGYEDKEILHPKYKTPQEKKIQVLKRRLKNAKRETTKQRIREQIKELQK